MAVSKKNGTANKDWAVPLPLLASRDGAAITIAGYRLSWHVIIYFVGVSGLVRAAVNVPGAVDGALGLGTIYGLCAVLALFIGRQIRIKGDARSPFFSAHLGMGGFAINAVQPIVIRHSAPLTIPSITVPLLVLAMLAALVYGTGQLAKRHPVPQASPAKNKR
jgi:hypothetical protein